MFQRVELRTPSGRFELPHDLPSGISGITLSCRRKFPQPAQAISHHTPPADAYRNESRVSFIRRQDRDI